MKNRKRRNFGNGPTQPQQQPPGPVPSGVPAGPPNVIVKPSVAQMTKVAVGVEGENVVLTIGNSDIRFHYEVALKLSQWLRISAKEAKRKAGDMSRHWSALAVLDGLK